MSHPRMLVICGTRPEVIKLAPVMAALRANPRFEVKLCVTGQHRELVAPMLAFFGLVPDFELNLMLPGQTPAGLTAAALTALGPVLEDVRPDCVVVQGDTTTAFAGALAAFHARRPVAHVEAGLRTRDPASPYPEEMNRVLTARLAAFHFAPTSAAAAHLAREGIERDVFVVGNTVIDALLYTRARVEVDRSLATRFSFLRADQPLVLITSHRRESFGAPFARICEALRTLAERNEGTQFVFPLHLNPQVRAPAERLLRAVPGLHLLEPVAYPELVWLLHRARLVLTDSGGLQEEAPTLGKPVLVLREATERPEGVAAGCARLVGTDPAVIVAAVEELLRDSAAYQSMSRAQNPYGDGTAAVKIASILAARLGAGWTGPETWR